MFKYAYVYWQRINAKIRSYLATTIGVCITCGKMLNIKWSSQVAGLANLNDDCSIAGHTLPLESNGYQRMFRMLQRDLMKKMFQTLQ